MHYRDGQEKSLQPFLCEAIDPETPPYRLKALAAHQAWLIRSLVAKNPNTPARAIEILLQDEHPIVRQSAYYGRR